MWCSQKKRITHVCLKKKTSFSFLKSRLKKADILGYFHLFLYGGDSIPNSCVLSSQRIHSTRTHIKRANRRSTCARKAQYLTPVKSERLKSSLIRVCEGERRATHFIFNLASLYPTFRESRRRTFKKESQRSLFSMAREAVVMRRHSAQQVRFYHRFCAFLLLSSSKLIEDARETKSCQPMCQSKCPFKNLRSRKKEERILSADDDIEMR